MYRILDAVVPHLPEDKPTYLMGVGTPANILEAVDRGVDFFDCVYPSRNGRHSHVYTNHGLSLIHISVNSSKKAGICEKHGKLKCLHKRATYDIIYRTLYTKKMKEDIEMKHVKTLSASTLKNSMKKGGCGECQTSCQSACKTSCTVGNQSCENQNR